MRYSSFKSQDSYALAKCGPHSLETVCNEVPSLGLTVRGCASLEPFVARRFLLLYGEVASATISMSIDR